MSRSERDECLTASDMAAVLGRNPYKTSYDVWLEKTGRIERREKQSEAALIGLWLEPHLLDWAERRLGTKLERQVWLRDGDFGATPDGLGADCVVEVKTTGLTGPAVGIWAPNPPPWVLVQVQGQMMVAGVPKGYVAALIGGLGLRWYEIVMDADLLLEIQIAGTKFMDYVRDDTPPVETVPNVSYLARRMRGGEGCASLTSADVLRYSQARTVAKEATAELKNARERLLYALGDYEVGIAPGIGRVTYYKSKSGTRSLRLIHDE